jgi:hypothetical protein
LDAETEARVDQRASFSWEIIHFDGHGDSWHRAPLKTGKKLDVTKQRVVDNFPSFVDALCLLRVTCLRTVLWQSIRIWGLVNVRERSSPVGDATSRTLSGAESKDFGNLVKKCSCSRMTWFFSPEFKQISRFSKKKWKYCDVHSSFVTLRSSFQAFLPEKLWQSCWILVRISVQFDCQNLSERCNPHK